MYDMCMYCQKHKNYGVLKAEAKFSNYYRAVRKVTRKSSQNSPTLYGDINNLRLSFEKV